MEELFLSCANISNKCSLALTKGLGHSEETCLKNITKSTLLQMLTVKK